jgi:hypothetical protein
MKVKRGERKKVLRWLKRSKSAVDECAAFTEESSDGKVSFEECALCMCNRGNRFFKKVKKFENRHVDFYQKKISKNILQHKFFEILSRFLRK